MSQVLMVLFDPEPSVLWLESWVAAEDSWKIRSESESGCEERRLTKWLLIILSPQKFREPWGILCGRNIWVESEL